MDYKKIILVEGKEEFLRKKKVDELINNELPDGITDFNYEKLDARQTSIADILSLWETIPFGAKERVLHVTDFGKVKANKGDKAAELFIQRVEKANVKHTTLILESESVDKKTTFFKSIHKLAESYKFDPIRDYQLPDFISRYTRDNGYTISREAVEFFKFFASTELMIVTSELDKLMVFCGDKKNIGIEEVKTLLMPSKEHTHFDLQDAIVEKNLSKALYVADGLTDSGVYLPVILGFLEGILKKSLAVKTARSKSDLDKISKSSFYINKLKALSDRFSEKHLEQLIVLTYKTLISSRKGVSNDGFYLSYLIASIIRKMK